MKWFPVFAVILACAAVSFSKDKSPVACGIAVGTGYNFGYFLNCGLEHIQEKGSAIPKANIGFFLLPGF